MRRAARIKPPPFYFPRSHEGLVQPLNIAKEIKHAALIRRRRLGDQMESMRISTIDKVHPLLRRLRGPFEYRSDRYQGVFPGLVSSEPTAGDLSKKVFSFWTGDNALTPNRERSLARLREVLGLRHVLVTAYDLDEWVLEAHPLHPAYEYLSLVHRSDYLRAYFAHHYGGGYVDLKAPTMPWVTAFERIARDDEAWFASDRLHSVAWVAQLGGSLGRDLRRHYHLVAANTAFAARPHSPFTAEWLHEVEARLDQGLEAVRRSPGGIRGEGPGYPFAWNELLNDIHHPLCLKYHAHIRYDDAYLLSREEYL